MHPPPLNERRVVTVMSVDVVGSTRLVAGLDPDDTQALLDAFLARIQSAVEGRGGVIVSFTGDGALVVFGWPEASEQHADNACRAAWEIQAPGRAAETRTNGVEVRVGVASGLVVVRKIEVGLVSRYDVIGDAAHRAAALQKRAEPGQALVCDSTHGLSRLRQFAGSVELDLGLRTGPVRAFSLRGAEGESPGARLASRHPFPVLGRDGELGRLRDFLRDTARPTAVLGCIGEPGLGKSRLAAAVSALGAEGGRHVVIHESRDIDGTSPFAAARAILLAALASGPSDGARVVADAFAMAEGAPDDLAAVLAIFEDAGGAKGPDVVEAASYARIARALARTFARGAIRQATLLIVEDVHNLDPETRQVLSYIAYEEPRAPLALFVTGRPEARDAVAAISQDIIELGPLNDQSLTRLINLTQATTLPQAAISHIVARAAGNPFVLTQLLEQPDLLEQNAVVLPRSVESLIHARLDRLGPDARRLVQALSLLGESVEEDLAVAIAGKNASSRSEAMAELERLAFIHPPTESGIRFRHALIAAACASSVMRERGRQVHAAAMDALSDRQRDSPDVYPRLAHHAEQAGRDERAIDYHWEAARRARSLGASQSLMATFDRALACCERLGAAGEERFVDLVLLVFETFHLLGEIDRIEPYLTRAADFARAQGRSDKLCIAQCHLGIAAWYRGSFAEGERIMRPALEQAKALGRLPLRFAAQFILAQQLHNQARIDEAIALVGELCDMLNGDLVFARLGAMGLPASIANSHAGYYALEAGRYEEAERWLLRGLAIAEKGADAYSESLARIALGRCFLLMERNAEALECLQRGLAIIQKHGYDPALLNVTGLLAAALSRTGSASEAIILAKARLADGLLGRTGSYERHYFWCGLGEALVSDGQAEEGLSRIEEAIAIGRATQNPCILVQSLSLKAAALRRFSGDRSEAQLAAAEARELERRFHLVAPRDAFSRA